jgi:hypothetical protein
MKTVDFIFPIIGTLLRVRPIMTVLMSWLAIIVATICKRTWHT